MDGHPVPRGTDRIPPTGRLTVTIHPVCGPGDPAVHAGAAGAAGRGTVAAGRARYWLVLTEARSWVGEVTFGDRVTVVDVVTLPGSTWR